MTGRTLRIAVGLALIVVAVDLVFSPGVVASALHRWPRTHSDAINLRASWGGTLLGLGMFVVWARALRPRGRTLWALLGFTMAGIGAARAVGFVIDGQPNALQWFWLSAEVLLVLLAAWRVRASSRS